MKKHGKVTSMMFLMAFLVGCGQDSTERKEESPEVTAKEVKEEAHEAVEAADEFVGKKTDEWRETLTEDLAELQLRLDQVEADLVAAGTATAEEAKKTLAKVKGELQSAKENLEVLKDSGKEAWKKTRTGIEKGIQELKDGYEKASEDK